MLFMRILFSLFTLQRLILMHFTGVSPFYKGLHFNFTLAKTETDLIPRLVNNTNFINVA